MKEALYKQIIEKQDELLKLYSECLSNHAGFLFIHGIEESEDNVSLGVKLRQEISDLKAELEKESDYRKCRGCGTPLSDYCEHCQHLLES